MGSFDLDVERLVRLVEVIGVAVLIGGSLIVLGHGLVLYALPNRRAEAYGQVRRHLGRTILVGLEILIVSDIVNTVIIEPTVGSVAVLGAIVTIRIVLSWSLSVEIDGVWPWRRRAALLQAPDPPNEGK